MSYTDSIYLLIFSSGFTVGFGHCIGMCGPIVASLSLGLKGRKTFIPHLLYNAGRITTYAILGGLMGMTGSFTSVASNLETIQKAAMIFSGTIIIVMSLGMSGWLGLGRIFGDYIDLNGVLSRGYKRISESRVSLLYLPTGLLLGLLPCGPVYTALIAAAGKGMEANHAWDGFFAGTLIMMSFGFGTVPALILVAKLADFRRLKWRKIVYKIGSILMFVVGVYFLVQGITY